MRRRTTSTPLGGTIWIGKRLRSGNADLLGVAAPGERAYWAEVERFGHRIAG